MGFYFIFLRERGLKELSMQIVKEEKYCNEKDPGLWQRGFLALASSLTNREALEKNILPRDSSFLA